MVVGFYTMIAYSVICKIIMSALHLAFAIGRNRIIYSCKVAVKNEILFREGRIKKYGWINSNKINEEIEDLRKADVYLTSTPYLKMLFTSSFDSHASKIEKYKILSKDAWIAGREKMIIFSPNVQPLRNIKDFLIRIASKYQRNIR